MKLTHLLLGATLALAGTLSVQAETIRIGTEGAYPPFNYVDAQGNVGGFDVDIAKALCDDMGVQCKIVTQDWDGIIPALKMHKYDAIIASMSITPERSKVVDFTDPYYTSGLRFVRKKGADFDPQHLAGKTIGAQRSTIAAQWLEDHAKGAHIKLYDTQENLYLDAASGRLDGFLSDVFPAYDWLKTTDGKNFEFVGETFAKNDKIGIAVRKGDKLRERFNKALAHIKANGVYAKINAKYFPFSIE